MTRGELKVASVVIGTLALALLAGIICTAPNTPAGPSRSHPTPVASRSPQERP